MGKDCLVEFSMTPLDKGESVSSFVARSLSIVDNSGVRYRINPMGTVLEGSWDDCFSLIKECYEAMKQDSNRITCSIKIDYRKGKTNRLESKIKSVEEKLNKNLNK